MTDRNISIETNENNISNESDVVLNELGRPTVPCEFCGIRYEASFDIKIHLLSCKTKKKSIKEKKTVKHP